MRQSEWYREVEEAANWWIERLNAAAKLAYPETSLFGNIRRTAVTSSSLLKFKEEFIRRVDAKLWSNERPTETASWDRNIPLKDSIRRRFGKETSILSTEIEESLEASGMGELSGFIPVGCMSVINPGRVFVAESRKHKDSIIVVRYFPPANISEKPGDGL